VQPVNMRFNWSTAVVNTTIFGCNGISTEQMHLSVDIESSGEKTTISIDIAKLVVSCRSSFDLLLRD